MEKITVSNIAGGAGGASFGGRILPTNDNSPPKSDADRVRERVRTTLVGLIDSNCHVEAGVATTENSKTVAFTAGKGSAGAPGEMKLEQKNGLPVLSLKTGDLELKVLYRSEEDKPFVAGATLVEPRGRLVTFRELFPEATARGARPASRRPIMR